MGIFPMAASASGSDLYWFEPPQRGVLPVGGVHISHSMRKLLRHSRWQARIDGDFIGVVKGCADRDETWINAELLALYAELFALGHAHSLEIREDDALIGGVFGLSLGGAFFAESMFSRRDNTSKAALIWLSGHLARCGFVLWDTQYPNPHLASMGGQTIPRGEYRRQLAQALKQRADFTAHALPAAQALVQDTTHTS
ncbi:leucyl/phenylalanyl-tRNA--protein transferase [Paracoccus lutimaris]|uniref:Leucyl/phenylalanyl-tRNA--protein transferase n=2 Tax=Paracoccus lutimaris TaxID=1490030 RepID=A0A368ZE38_9RHOB|nr:leucyl/phenylalanyl-tRNA--protein transferase [Paracoccus lutimaris]